MSDNDTAASPTDWCRVHLDPEGPSPTVVVRERIRLSDTDSSGLIYFGAVSNWLNRAEAELWYALGFTQQGRGPSPMMPVVNATVDYHGSLYLADPYELRAWVDQTGRTSVTTGFEVSKDGQRCVSATITHVHLDPDTLRPAPLPPAITDAARRHR
jgi:acyl-CoA thioester hydrolase